MFCKELLAHCKGNLGDILFHFLIQPTLWVFKKAIFCILSHFDVVTYIIFCKSWNKCWWHWPPLIISSHNSPMVIFPPVRGRGKGRWRYRWIEIFCSWCFSTWYYCLHSDTLTPTYHYSKGSPLASHLFSQWTELLHIN